MAGPPPAERVIPDKRLKPPKHKKNLLEVAGDRDSGQSAEPVCATESGLQRLKPRQSHGIYVVAKATTHKDSEVAVHNEVTAAGSKLTHESLTVFFPFENSAHGRANGA